MFTYTEEVTFEWPVKVKVPTSGGYEEFEFTGHFLLLPEQDVVDDKFDMRRSIERVWTGWSGIQTPDKKPLPYSDEARANLLRQPHILSGVFHAYMDAISGAVREKN